MELTAKEFELLKALVLAKGRKEHRYSGEEARKVAGVVVARINRSGAGKQSVQDAVRRLDHFGSPDAMIRAAAGEESRSGFKSAVTWSARPKRAGHLAQLSIPTRLAVEMALHEEQERRALEGELWLLERRWKEAEEIAAISDSLLLPEGTEEFLEKHRTGREG